MKTIHGRKEFLGSNESNSFAESVSNQAFISGLRVALLEFMADQPRGNTWEDAARSHHYVQGAKDFAEYLLTFTDAEPQKPQPTNENLKWPTKQSLQRQPKANK